MAVYKKLGLFGGRFLRQKIPEKLIIQDLTPMTFRLQHADTDLPGKPTITGSFSRFVIQLRQTALSSLNLISFGRKETLVVMSVHGLSQTRRQVRCS